MEVEVFGMAGIPEGAVPGGPPSNGAEPSTLFGLAWHACMWRSLCTSFGGASVFISCRF